LQPYSIAGSLFRSSRFSLIRSIIELNSSSNFLPNLAET
jgi:hypothetical protein